MLVPGIEEFLLERVADRIAQVDAQKFRAERGRELLYGKGGRFLMQGGGCRRHGVLPTPVACDRAVLRPSIVPNRNHTLAIWFGTAERIRARPRRLEHSRREPTPLWQGEDDQLVRNLARTRPHRAPRNIHFSAAHGGAGAVASVRHWRKRLPAAGLETVCFVFGKSVGRQFAPEHQDQVLVVGACKAAARRRQQWSRRPRVG